MQIFNQYGWAILMTALTIVGASSPWVHAESGTHTAVGKVSAINLKYDTVVVEAPIAGGKRMTVGGPLVDGAKLEKNNQPAALENFDAGEKVTIQWRSTDTGHEILALSSQ